MLQQQWFNFRLMSLTLDQDWATIEVEVPGYMRISGGLQTGLAEAPR